MRNSTLFAAISATVAESPVMLPPGSASPATKPAPTGSPLKAMTMGIVRVACWAARTAGVGAATITSTLSRTISAARPEAAQRHEVAPLDRWFLLNALSESGVVRALEQPGRVHAGALLTGWAECSRVRQRRPKQTIQKVRGLVTGLALAEITGLPLGLRMILSVSTWQVNPNMNGERNS